MVLYVVLVVASLVVGAVGYKVLAPKVASKVTAVETKVAAVEAAVKS